MLIGEVSRRCGVSARMLRHYDALGLVRPTGRTTGGYREYSVDDIRRLFHVESLRTLGLSLGEVGRALDEPDFAPGALVADLIGHTRARIETERDLLARLERVDAAAPTEWGEVLRLVTLLRALESESGARRQQAVLTQHEGDLPVDALVAAALTEDDLNVAGALRWSVSRTPGGGLAEFGAGLASGSAPVRCRAVDAIAAVPTAEATVLLHGALGDADEAVRERAALALGARGCTDASSVLLRMVVAGHRDVEAAEALGRMSGASDSADRVVRALQGAFGATADAATRSRITQALAEIPGDAARHALTALTRDPDRTVSATATAILRYRDGAGRA